jgi:8-oxo-dGTP pyrophosphatase MutT (NUDIX family)
VRRAPGKVGFPGGSVEPGETQAQAVVREMAEELSVHVRPIEAIWSADDQVPGFVLVGWRAELLTPADRIVADPAEVAEVLWLSTDALLAHADGFENNHLFLEALEAAEAATRR